MATNFSAVIFKKSGRKQKQTNKGNETERNNPSYRISRIAYAVPYSRSVHKIS